MKYLKKYMLWNKSVIILILILIYLKFLLIKLNVRLACVKHLNSVQSEPSPNSFNILDINLYLICFLICNK